MQAVRKGGLFYCGDRRQSARDLMHIGGTSVKRVTPSDKEIRPRAQLRGAASDQSSSSRSMAHGTIALAADQHKTKEEDFPQALRANRVDRQVDGYGDDAVHFRAGIACLSDIRHPFDQHPNDEQHDNWAVHFCVLRKG
jgi:hypothetical protein